MYWLRACVDIDKATDDAKSGKQLNGVVYKEYEAMVTIPLSTLSLNLVSSLKCLSSLKYYGESFVIFWSILFN